MSRWFALAGVCLASGLASAAQPALAGQSLGFAVSWLVPALLSDEGDCPDGFNEALNWQELLRKMGRTPAQIKELMAPDNARKFMVEVLHRGRNGADVCAEPETDYLTETPWKTVTGKVAYGENLDGTQDGRETATTCRHEKFISPEGVPVDNQFYRVMACGKPVRGGTKGSTSNAYKMERMKEGMVTLVLEVTGIDDLQNDPDVRLILGKGVEPLKKDAAGEVLSNTTITVFAEPHTRVEMRGSIKDGVLTTEPMDFTLAIQNAWQPPQMNLTGARVKARIEADGSFKGTMAAYQDWRSIYYAHTRSAPLHEQFNAGNCPGIFQAFKKLADGGKDPKTGECTTMSNIWAIEAVPAFLVHQENPKTAEAKSVRTTESQPPR